MYPNLILGSWRNCDSPYILQESMQEMVSEIEARAPLLRKQREEHELAQATIEEMKVRIEENEEYMKRVQCDYEQQTRRSTYLERAYKRGKIQINDLSLQVRFLILKGNSLVSTAIVGFYVIVLFFKYQYGIDMMLLLKNCLAFPKLLYSFLSFILFSLL